MTWLEQIVTGVWREFSLGMGGTVAAAYLTLALATACAAVKHRRDGRRCGALFSLLLMTIPAWVGGLFWLFVNVRLIVQS